ncbi:MAG TPA: HD domain-containing phosphohydrolase [Candidatus Sulfotelmatobacter sp.]|nr:HD domain-containing phosphohydrolase [Candidatus Sulfotelmatobacter sp.]
MSEDAQKKLAAGSGVTGDKHTFDFKVREAGLRLVMRLAGVIRVGRAYQVGNHLFREQMSSFLDSLRPILDDTREVVLVALETDLYLNGLRIPVRTANIRFHQVIHDEFQRRKIAGIKVEPGLDLDELERFFSYFMQPDVYHGTALLEACLANHVDHILPAIHASTEAPGPDIGMPEEEPREAFEDAWSTEEQKPEEEQEDPHILPGGAVRKNYSMAVDGMRSLLATTSLHEGFHLKHAKRVVQPLVDDAFKHQPVVVGLAVLRQHDEYTYAHAVNVCIVSVSMGYFLELDRKALADLGVAALLHDVGKSVVMARIRHGIDEFTDQEKLAAEKHAIEGAKLLARTTALNSTTLRCMRVAMEHHLPQDPTGDPKNRGDWTPNVLSRIVSVADCYVSLLTHRSRGGQAITPYDALGRMLGPMASRFDAAMLWALVQSVGIYPPGQLVELSDGALAIVLAPNSEDLYRPRVRVLTDAQKNLLTASTVYEYQPLPEELKIVRALKADEYPEYMKPPAPKAA